ncbi:hypothetical protein ES705_20742 [subsurface metagenome]
MQLWQVVIDGKVDTVLTKKLKKVLRTVHSVGRVQDCLFCGVDTTWTINDKPVCPKCAVGYGFLGKQWLLDPCEVCGKQGEWATEGDPQHFLCHYHRDDWFHWKNPELDFINHKNQPEKWHQVWEEGWNKFVTFMQDQRSEGER